MISFANMTKMFVESCGMSAFNGLDGGKLNHNVCAMRIPNFAIVHFSDLASQGDYLLYCIFVIILATFLMGIVIVEESIIEIDV